MSNNDRIVFRRGDGQWINRRVDSDRAGSVHGTQSDARDAAKQMLNKAGGGELTVKGIHGKFVSKDTIPPGHDPCPPRDKEH